MKISKGDRVRLTGAFLRNTGQVVGGEGLSRWTVTDIVRDFAITDEPTTVDCYTASEIMADPTLAFRRIHLANLERANR